MSLLSEIFQQMILYVRGSSEINEFSLAQILGTRKPIAIPPMNCDMMNPETIGMIVNVIIGNFTINNQQFDLEMWQSIFYTLMSCIQEVENYNAQLAKLSLFITISRLADKESFCILFKMLNTIQIQELPYQPCQHLVEIVHSTSIRERFQSFSHSSNYQYLPTILLGSCIPQELQGWVCLNNIIVINQELFPVRTTMTDIMAVSSTILYLAKHQDLQMVENNFNSYTPPSETGWLLEQAIWGGYRFSWCDPINAKDTDRLAQSAFNRIQQQGGALNLTAADRALLKSSVGTRPEQSLGGLDWYQPYEIAE